MRSGERFILADPARDGVIRINEMRQAMLAGMPVGLYSTVEVGEQD
jgi:hypothetical protein